MSLGKNRALVFVKGLGNLDIIEREPSAGTDYDNLGNLESTVYNDEPEMQDIKDECGNMLLRVKTGHKIVLASNLLQSSIDEINVPRLADGKIYAARYHGQVNSAGVYQYLVIPNAQIDPKLNLAFQSGTKRTIPIVVTGVKQSDVDYDIPVAFIWQGDALMSIDKCKLWIDPMQLLNTGTVKIMDISGFGRHGTLNASTLWNSGGYLVLDGTDDYVSFGDILDDDGTSDFAIEMMLRIQGADASTQEILSKKSLISNDSAGFAFYRNSSNKIVFVLSDGDSTVTLTSSTSVLQNVWTHIAVAVDRNGNAQLYINGVADGSAASVAAQTTGTNALNYYIGRDGTNFGQLDCGTIRHHIYGAGLLPSNIATIALNHYNSEKAKYGL